MVALWVIHVLSYLEYFWIEYVAVASTNPLVDKYNFCFS